MVKQKQEEKAAVAEAKARAKQERQEAKLAKKNKNADVEDTEETPEEIPAEQVQSLKERPAEYGTGNNQGHCPQM